MVPLLVMPPWMQALSIISPVRWSILALEGAIWRGFSWAELLPPCAVLLGVGTAAFFLGVWLLTRQER
jgi:ABC-2 type transport system permease protein